MKKLSFLSLILAFLLCFSSCVTLQLEADDSAVPVVQTTQPVQSAPLTTQSVAADTSAVVQTTQPVQQTTQPVQQATQPSQEVQTTQIAVGNAAAANWSIAEIIAFFNSAVGRAKSNLQPYVLKESAQHFISMQNINSPSMQSMAQSVVEKLNRNTVNEYNVVSGVATGDGVQANISDLLPPAGAVFSVQESEVTAARAAYEGGNVLIVMTLSDDTASAVQPIPAAHGAKLPYVSLQGQSIDPYTLQDARINYTGITFAASVDEQGRLLTLTISASVAGTATGGIGVMTAEMQFGGTLKHVWTFTYA